MLVFLLPFACFSLNLCLASGRTESSIVAKILTASCKRTLFSHLYWKYVDMIPKLVALSFNWRLKISSGQVEVVHRGFSSLF